MEKMDTVTTISFGLLGVILGSIGSIVAQYLQHRLSKSVQIDSVRRQIYADWLAEVFDLEEELQRVWFKRGPSTTYTEEERRSYHLELSWRAVFKSLEAVRMMASTKTEIGATAVMTVLGECPQWQGPIDVPYSDWRGDYWEARRTFINLARLEFGEDPINFGDNERYVNRHIPNAKTRNLLGTGARDKKRP